MKSYTGSLQWSIYFFSLKYLIYLCSLCENTAHLERNEIPCLHSTGLNCPCPFSTFFFTAFFAKPRQNESNPTPLASLTFHELAQMRQLNTKLLKSYVGNFKINTARWWLEHTLLFSCSHILSSLFATD